MTAALTRLLLAALLLAGLLAGCGGDPQEEYCEAVKDRQEELTEITTSGERTALLEALPVFRDLAAEAPSDIRHEWRQVVSSLEGLEEALDEAGVDPATYDARKPPPGLVEEERQRIEAAAGEVASNRTVEALAGVEQHARDVCKTPLSL